LFGGRPIEAPKALRRVGCGEEVSPSRREEVWGRDCAHTQKSFDDLLLKWRILMHISVYSDVLILKFLEPVAEGSGLWRVERGCALP